jgi:antitoxin YefM
MQAITYSEARNNLATHLDRVVMDSDITIITRQKSEPAVLMSLKDYENLMETLHLLRGKNEVVVPRPSMGRLFVVAAKRQADAQTIERLDSRDRA